MLALIIKRHYAAFSDPSDGNRDMARMVCYFAGSARLMEWFQIDLF
jgi:hypothetical protein